MKMAKGRRRRPANRDTGNLKTIPPVAQIASVGPANEALAEEERFVGEDLLEALEEQIKHEADPARVKGKEKREEWNRHKSSKSKARLKKAAKEGSDMNHSLSSEALPKESCEQASRGGIGNDANNQLSEPLLLNSQALLGRDYEYGILPYGIQIPSMLPQQQTAWSQTQTLPFRVPQTRPVTRASARLMQQGWAKSYLQSLPNNQLPFGKPADDIVPTQYQSRNATAVASATGKLVGRMGHHVDEEGRIVYRYPPQPSEAYMQQSNKTDALQRCLLPRRLLIILDLNGVLLFRPNRKQLTKFKPRPDLDQFFSYIFANHEVMVWSSARSENVSSMCKELFSEEQHSKLVTIWARDKLRLTPIEYDNKAQVYKQLSWVWEDTEIGTRALSVGQQKWSQSNTVLIDDSSMKASAEPYNLLQVPEFKGQDESFSAGPVLDQVAGYLEEVKYASDASQFIRTSPFKVDAGWDYDP